MGIYAIKINNFKSIKNMSFKFDESMFCIMGKNGAGKTNFFYAIEYFYKNLNKKNNQVEDVLDSLNSYSQSMKIEIIYDFSVLHRNITNSYLENMINDIDEYIVDDKVSLQMKQYKNGEVQWYPKDIKLRKCISKLFPVYIVNTRRIALQEWSLLWDVATELAISNTKMQEKDINENLDIAFEKIYGEKYTKSIEIIEKILCCENVGINNKNYGARFKTALQARFSGSEFVLEENSLDFYSDGMNSLNYIKLFVQFISELAKRGWKNPFIILDEPEMGLHVAYIEVLSEYLITNLNSRIQIILSTHSPYLVAYLMKNNVKISINRIYKKQNYSVMERVRELVEDTEKNIISAKETECYFSNAIVFVEGRTEYQVFGVNKIIEMYPFLKTVNFYPSADSVNMRIIHPSNGRYTVPYLVLTDMDKIICYKKSKGLIKTKKDKVINPLENEKIKSAEQNLYFKRYGKKKDLMTLRKNIYDILDTHRFTMNEYGNCHDTKYEKLIYNIKEYCLRYNVFAVRTTIEGCIINNQSVDMIIEWMLQEKDIGKTKAFEDYIKKLSGCRCESDKVSGIRLLFNGKSDCLETLEEMRKNQIIDKKVSKQIKSVLQSNKISKTDGWINEFFEYYFTMIEKKETKTEKIKSRFESDFQELSEVLQMIRSMLV